MMEEAQWRRIDIGSVGKSFGIKRSQPLRRFIILALQSTSLRA